MHKTLKYLEQVEDLRQKKKILYKMSDIIALVFFAMLANADEWIAIEIFGKEHEKFLRRYLELPNGIPSHDTIQRVFSMVSPEFLQKFQLLWNEMLSSGEGEKIKKILAIDGKTQCGNRNKDQNANHIVSAVDEKGICLGQKRVEEKTNEITAIPELLDDLNVKGHIITTDAMGTQTQIVKKIWKKKADYVLALKGNQGRLHEDVKLYFDDVGLLEQCAYTKTIEKARGGIEKREYWQSVDIAWLEQKKDWAGLKSIAMTRNTIVRNEVEITETRYFISSLPLEVSEIARAIRGHWMVESFHWHLDVTFREDDNHTLEKQAAFNLNIMRKLALNVLRIYELRKTPMSLKMKRFAIGTNPERHLENILNL
ncbi:ISAs1 family transposase [Anaerocolumna cellulosilytica]|uniref:ISAs1 family transposase n=1 Tax=Anaerocolumna cellulosilytica TaxID=433286 RepID=A0A6S6R9Q1_9FIRM|nr:ISAs1 family transposase [Anaerocolumna cellulosilytica]MBB5198186.1 putative transposase YbfD/YdcC [Anaerocolumna cellulosilytica]BCJ93140.1 ISAs1 family transposase [Anaerocolumna cellulosilytica]BCJ94003.1 ISAs1 family transposase [Anaerocolumna cellulosilytica]BCJ94098.1 ISAs1 family transposase [Anaerocolumna cellulosilytica]BCJ95088.1 ISAs1 family transposase [Anaerocolumna cellulosilytica]